MPHHSKKQQRPEFACAVVIRETKQTPLGLSFQRQQGRIVLSKVAADGRFGQSPLRVGDTLLKINDQDIAGGKVGMKETQELLKNHVGRLTLVAHNAKGQRRQVETMVERHGNTELGMRFSVNVDGLQVAGVKGLWADTLVDEGDPVLSVNSVPCEQLSVNAVME